MSFAYRNEDGTPNYTANITGVAFSNQTILIVSTLGFGALGLVLFLILRHLSPTAGDDHDEQDQNRDVYGEMLDQSDVATLNRAQRRAKAKFRMKKARRAVAPTAQEDEGGGEADNDVGNNDLADANQLTRKERQRAAKEMERKERKVYAKEAQLWREKKQSTMKSEGSSSCDVNEHDIDSEEADKLSLEDVFPQYANEHDATSEYLFWESIMKNLKQKENSDDIMSIAEQIPKMIIRDFIERLKRCGKVSTATLAEEFGISCTQAMDELENNINKKHGIVGIPHDGYFVYVSLEMIKEAIKIGQDSGRLSCPTR